MKNNSIIYLGDSYAEFLDPNVVKSVLDCRFKILSLNESYKDLFGKIIPFSPSIIMIEITKLDSEFLSFLLLLKTHSYLKESTIIAIFPSKENLDDHSDIYSFGVEYGFIAGEDSQKIIEDLGVFIDSSKFKPALYARAKNVYIPAVAHFSGKISHLSKDELNIETALELSEKDIVEISINLDESLCLNFFKVIKNKSFLPRTFFPSGITLKILYDGDPSLGSEIVGEISTKENVSSYLDKLKEKSFVRNDPALIIDSNTETLADLIDELNVNNSHIKITNSYLYFEEHLPLFLPLVICYQMDSEDESMDDEQRLKINGPTVFDLLIKKIKTISNYSPFVLVFNERSRSQAYRKAHSYQKILVNRKKFEFNYLSMILSEFQKNHKIVEGNVYFKPPSSNSIINIAKEVFITSLSENQITFLYEGSLNLYSTFMLDDPLGFFVTIIPSQEESKGGKRKKIQEYLGLITSTSEEQKMELRKLVNLLIKMELPEGEVFTLKSVSDLRKDILEARSLEIQNMRITQKKEFKERSKGEEEDI